MRESASSFFQGSGDTKERKEARSDFGGWGNCIIFAESKEDGRNG